MNSNIDGIDTYASDEDDHVAQICEALGDRKIPGVSIPFHVRTVWVALADGSTLQIGDDDDNMRLEGGHGYCVYRDHEGQGVGGPDNDGVVMSDRNATFDQLIDFIVAQVNEHGPAPRN
jgi:hypothetical protein